MYLYKYIESLKASAKYWKAGSTTKVNIDILMFDDTTLYCIIIDN